MPTTPDETFVTPLDKLIFACLTAFGNDIPPLTSIEQIADLLPELVADVRHQTLVSVDEQDMRVCNQCGIHFHKAREVYAEDEDVLCCSTQCMSQYFRDMAELEDMADPEDDFDETDAYEQFYEGLDEDAFDLNDIDPDDGGDDDGYYEPPY